MRRTKPILALLAVAVLEMVQPLRAHASVTLSTGDSALFSFDFSVSSPAPPYSSLVLTWQFSDFDMGSDQHSRIFFDGLDGSGAVLFTQPTTSALIISTTFLPTATGILDGQFSFRITDVAGTYSLDPVAVAYSATGQPTEQIAGVLVPVPATGSLLGIGLAGLAVARRRVRH